MSLYGCDTCQFEIFLFKKYTATWKVPRVKLTLVVFNLVPLSTILIQFSPLIF